MKSKGLNEDQKRLIIFVGIAIVCVLAIIEGVYLYTFSPDGSIEGVGGGDVVAPVEDKSVKLKEQFPNIFKNDLMTNADITNIQKKDIKHNLIYTDYEKTESVTGHYEIDAQIPHINIDSPEITTINNNIDEIFKTTIDKIVTRGSENVDTIYSVKYRAYLNRNVLSLVIQCTLRTEQTPQKVLFKTYCYNTITQKRVQLSELTNSLNIAQKDVEEKVKSEIESQILMEKSLEEAGYNVYKRQKESDMYKFANIDTYFIDNENNLYILFPYGNTNNTSEVDIIIF